MNCIFDKVWQINYLTLQININMIRLKKLTMLIVMFLIVTSQMSAQDSQKVNGIIGQEIQVYPTGIIPGLKYELPIGGLSALYLRAGYQIIDHRDLGVQDNETGSGYGFSLGYKKYLSSDQLGWAFMLKTDLWFNTIDWETTNIAGELITGQSKIKVLQPTLQAEYGFSLSEKIILSPSVAFGIEWNIATEGSDVGEGSILLLGLSLGYKL